MSNKKKLLLRPADEDATTYVEEVVDLAGTEMECPQHPDHLIVIQRDGALLFAVCNCAVRNNMWRNKRVWEHADSIEAPVAVTAQEGE